MFKIGDKIVYPNHGAGTIDSIEKKEFLGIIQLKYALQQILNKHPFYTTNIQYRGGAW